MPARSGRSFPSSETRRLDAGASPLLPSDAVRIRVLRAALAATLLLPVGPMVGLSGAHHREGPCALHRWEEESVRQYSKRLIRCAADEWPVKGGAARAICIADRESNLIPTAVGRGLTEEYLGLFQHAATYWPDRFSANTDPGWQLSDRALNARSNTIVTIRMVAAAGGWKAAGWPVLGCR